MSQELDLADFLQRFSTKVLWHFTGYNKTEEEAFSILKKIIVENTLNVSKEPFKIKMPSGKERNAFCSSCMCDIPFKDLRIHTSRYGHYGIAFKKINSIKNGHFNPVFYIQHDHHLFKQAEKILDAFDNEETNIVLNNHALHEYLMIIGTYTKRSNLIREISIGDPVVDTEQNNNFYYEREWRSAYTWKFNARDLAAIMLPQKHLEEMKDFLNTNSSLKSFNSLPLISFEMVEFL